MKYYVLLFIFEFSFLYLCVWFNLTTPCLFPCLILVWGCSKVLEGYTSGGRGARRDRSRHRWYGGNRWKLAPFQTRGLHGSSLCLGSLCPEGCNALAKNRGDARLPRGCARIETTEEVSVTPVSIRPEIVIFPSRCNGCSACPGRPRRRKFSSGRGVTVAPTCRFGPAFPQVIIQQTVATSARLIPLPLNIVAFCEIPPPFLFCGWPCVFDSHAPGIGWFGRRPLLF